LAFGIRSYQHVLGGASAQSIQQALAAMCSLVFVGMGDGAGDPNFKALRRWMVATFPDTEYRHFRLCLNSEVSALEREHAQGERIVPLGFGDGHEELITFLRDLGGDPFIVERPHRPIPATLNQKPGRDTTRTIEQRLREQLETLYDLKVKGWLHEQVWIDTQLKVLSKMFPDLEGGEYSGEAPDE
jgi:hypothetical protein